MSRQLSGPPRARRRALLEHHQMPVLDVCGRAIVVWSAFFLLGKGKQSSSQLIHSSAHSSGFCKALNGALYYRAVESPIDWLQA